MSSSGIPPPPPPPAIKKVSTSHPIPSPLLVSPKGPPGAFLVELLIYNGHPFKDHWAYFIRSHENPQLGVKIHATGDVLNGFIFQIKRSHDLDDTEDIPTKRVPLQWVNGEYVGGKAMLNFEKDKIDVEPVCSFEVSAYKAKAPGKSLNAAGDLSQSGKRVTQRNCQTWIVESADCLVQDGIFNSEVAVYLHAILQ